MVKKEQLKSLRLDCTTQRRTRRAQRGQGESGRDDGRLCDKLHIRGSDWMAGVRGGARKGRETIGTSGKSWLGLEILGPQQAPGTREIRPWRARRGCVGRLGTAAYFVVLLTY